MRLSSVKRGDIVRVNDGATPFYAMATHMPKGQRLQVRTLGWRSDMHRTVKATDVTGIWHQSKHTEPEREFQE